MKPKTFLLAGALAMSAVSTAQADVITLGHLQTDDQYHIIADTVRGREYLRLDSFDLTAAQTFSAVEEGGLYEGWSIASAEINNDFIHALLGQTSGNECAEEPSARSETVCGQLSTWSDNLLGVTHVNNEDHYAYLTHEDDFNSISLTQILADGTVIDRYSWGDIRGLDAHRGANAINLLLYRDNGAHLNGFNELAVLNNTVEPGGGLSVSAPTTLGLFAATLGLFGLRKKKAHNSAQ